MPGVRTRDAEAKGPEVAEPAPKARGSLLAYVRERFAPAFRPRWWEFAIPLAIAAGAYPLVTRLFWAGEAGAFEAVSGRVVVWGLPVAVVFLVKFWRSPHERAKAAARALLQVTILILLLVILNIAGRMAYAASVEETVRNAHAVLKEIRSFRKREGRLPNSLAELERSAGRDLPGPTFGGEFGYEVRGDDFVLRTTLPCGRTIGHDSRGRQDSSEDPPAAAAPGMSAGEAAGEEADE